MTHSRNYSDEPKEPPSTFASLPSASWTVEGGRAAPKFHGARGELDAAEENGRNGEPIRLNIQHRASVLSNAPPAPCGVRTPMEARERTRLGKVPAEEAGEREREKESTAIVVRLVKINATPRRTASRSPNFFPVITKTPRRRTV